MTVLDDQEFLKDVMTSEDLPEEEVQEVEEDELEEEELHEESDDETEVGTDDQEDEEESDEDSEEPEEGDSEVDDEGDQEASDESIYSGSGESEEGTQEEAEKTEESSEEEIDYKAFYDIIMTPFKANGTTVTLKSPDEAIRLMQMGANYTKRMQEIKPYRKIIMMLENNDLKDEDKIGYLIDLYNKDEAAIQKLLKEANIDPLDIDVDSEPTYQGGRHTISNEEEAFVSVLREVKAEPNGAETIAMFNSWDEGSKEAIWRDPNLVRIIHGHKQSGIFDTVMEEVERQRLLGAIPESLPLIDAYYQVGEILNQNGKLGGQAASPAPKPKAPVAVRKSKSNPSNSRKAKRASHTRSTNKRAESTVDIYNMDDDEFLKQFENRL